MFSGPFTCQYELQQLLHDLVRLLKVHVQLPVRQIVPAEVNEKNNPSSKE